MSSTTDDEAATVPRADDALPCGIALTAHDDGFRDDPHAAYDRLRTHAPRHQDAEYGRILLTRHDDVRRVLRERNFGVDARRTREDSYMRRVAGTGVHERAGSTAYEPPLVLLDDPLSAVDPRVGRILFDACIGNGGLMAGGRGDGRAAGRAAGRA